MKLEKNKFLMTSSLKDKIITCAIVVIFFAIAQVLVNAGMVGSLFKGLLIPMCYYIIMAVSLNLTVGVLGELSLGHAGFVCVGAYVGGFFSLITQDTIASAAIRFPLALLVGGITAAIFGILIGIPILRLQGDYLAIVTLAFGEIIRKVIQNVYIIKDINGLHFGFTTPIDPSTIDLATKQDIINGPMAVGGIPKDTKLWIAVVLAVITIIVIMNLVDSRSGRAIMAIRDNRIAAEATGIDISKHKLIVFTVSAFFAGIAGVLYAHFGTLTTVKFDYNMSILILVFVVLGGIGNIRGSIIAAVLLYALPEMLRELQAYRMLAYAILLIVMMILRNNDKFNQGYEKFVAKIRSMVKIGKKKKEEAA